MAMPQGTYLAINLDYCLVVPENEGERIIEGECLIEADLAGGRWRSATRSEGGRQPLIRYMGDGSTEGDPAVLLSRLTGQPVLAR